MITAAEAGSVRKGVATREREREREPRMRVIVPLPKKGRRLSNAK